MKTNIVILCIAALSLVSCEKNVNGITSSIVKKGSSAVPPTHEYVKYTINKGEQYCDKNFFMPTKYTDLTFNVKFDSSAIYKTVSSSNQNDINKLFGFSDNNKQHHEFSARFGWRWSNNALRLFAYVYNDGKMTIKELGTVAIGAENTCSIKVSGATYVFTLNGKGVTIPRASTTTVAEGYKLYPYFGGDELAPHTVSIMIKEL